MAVILTDCRRGRWRGRGDWATVVKKWWRKHSARVVLGHGEKRRGVWSGAVQNGVLVGSFYIAGEGRRGGVTAGDAMAFNG
jgi:hypothetical protein